MNGLECLIGHEMMDQQGQMEANGVGHDTEKSIES
jgi:hypothetical protein